MKFREYLEKLNKLADTNPETLDFTVVAASDAEGNSYSEVYYSPTIGYFDPEFNDDTFYHEEDKDDYEIEEPNNAICIN